MPFPSVRRNEARQKPCGPLIEENDVSQQSLMIRIALRGEGQLLWLFYCVIS